MKSLFSDKITIKGMMIAFKPGTKTPTAMGDVIKAQDLEAYINRQGNSIMFKMPQPNIQVADGDIVINQKSRIIDGSEYLEKYKIVSWEIIGRYPFNQVNLEVEVIQE